MHARPVLQAALALLVLALASPAPLLARTVVVPDSFPTIQAAIDALEITATVDTLLVKSGRYQEDLLVHKGMLLLPYPATNPYGHDALPQAGALTFVPQSDYGTGFDVSGFRFRGPVRVLMAGPGMTLSFAFSTCRMDSGLVVGKDNPWRVWVCRVTGCTVAGGIDISAAAAAHARLNSVYGGGLSVYGEGYFTIEGNLVQGPAAIGILGRDGGGGSTIAGNTVSGATVGIQVMPDGYEWVTDNEAVDCSGTAFLQTGSHGAMYARNTVLRCGGRGFDLQGSTFALAGNRVVGCGADGFNVTASGSCTADTNVVGRCGGAGFDLDQATLRGNTSYLNQGDGYVVRAGGTVANNIAYGNSGYGLSWLAGSTPSSIGCNDWYENTAGAVNGTSPGASDVSLNPGFCDLATDDAHLAADSPLLDLAGCGRVGALGQGCAAAAAVAEAQAQPAAFAAGPNPSGASVRFAWRAGLEPTSIEIFDVAGSLHWSQTLAPGAHTLDWSAVGRDGRRLAPGVYYARLAAQGTSLTRRIVLVR